MLPVGGIIHTSWFLFDGVFVRQWSLTQPMLSGVQGSEMTLMGNRPPRLQVRAHQLVELESPLRCTAVFAVDLLGLSKRENKHSHGQPRSVIVPSTIPSNPYPNGPPSLVRTHTYSISCPLFGLVRACRNAIEFNSIPSIQRLVPGGYDALKLNVLLAVPPKYQATLDLEEVKKVFPYGAAKFTIQDGGMIAPSGIAIDTLGDTNEDMVIVCAAVTVGY